MLHLDSRHRVNTHEHAGTPQWHLTRPIACNSIKLLSCQIPHSFLTIAPDMPDDALQFQTGSTPLDVVIDKKHFTGTSLASEIQTRVRGLDAAYAAFTATFDPTTLRLTFSYTSNYTVIATDDRMAAVTGLVKNKIAFSSGALISDNQVELSPPCLYLVSTSLG